MRPAPLACLVLLLLAGGAQAGEWRAETVKTPARVAAIDPTQGARVDAGGLWYRLIIEGAEARLTYVDEAAKPETPDNALPHGRVAVGTHDIARAWLAEPTPRYGHGVLGDKVEAGSLMIETRDGKMQAVRLKDDAVFEDLTPRLADLDGDGREEVVLVKSYLKRGAALAVIGRHEGKYTIIAETPPSGAPRRWLNPAGIADFNGDGKIDIALVRMPHVEGQLELWTWKDKRLVKSGEIADTTNHIAGSRALDMSVVADFDGDRIPDLAIPSFDRARLRLISFAPEVHEIANIALPAKAATNLARVSTEQGTSAIALGLADGTLALVRQAP